MHTAHINSLYATILKNRSQTFGVRMSGIYVLQFCNSHRYEK